MWLDVVNLADPASVATTNRRFRGAGVSYLLAKALGSTHARGRYVNVSDGGHIENLALYQLLRRRCAVIIATDGEADAKMTFSSLATLMRFARIDLGVRLEIDLEPLRETGNGWSKSCWVAGTIHYGPSETGTFLYIKASVDGSEPEDLRRYKE